MDAGIFLAGRLCGLVSVAMDLVREGPWFRCAGCRRAFCITLTWHFFAAHACLVAIAFVLAWAACILCVVCSVFCCFVTWLLSAFFFFVCVCVCDCAHNGVECAFLVALCGRWLLMLKAIHCHGSMHNHNSSNIHRHACHFPSRQYFLINNNVSNIRECTQRSQYSTTDA